MTNERHAPFHVRPARDPEAVSSAAFACLLVLLSLLAASGAVVGLTTALHTRRPPRED